MQRLRDRINAPRVMPGDVEQIVRRLKEAGVDCWIAGGWGIDCLVGRPTRSHSDLDLIIDRANEQRALRALEQDGFRLLRRIDAGCWLDVQLELIDQDRRAVALLPVPLADDGWPRSIRAAAKAIGLSAGEVLATGSLEHARLPCVSSHAQLVMHTGYEIRDRDRHDVLTLCQHLSLAAPEPYQDSRNEARTMLFIPVPEAERALRDWERGGLLRRGPGRLRRQLGDPGLVLHVTILYPFLDASAVDAKVERELEELFGSYPAFAYSLREFGRFPGVLFLVPDPSAPFVELTNAVHRRWPDHPPYGGAFDEVKPHVTIALGRAPQSLRSAARAALPIAGTAREVWLLVEQANGGWLTRRTFSLGARARAVR